MRSVEIEISQNVQPLSEQARKLVTNAKMIRAEPFHQFRDKLSFESLWLRPAVGGISAISYHADTPQRGFGIASIQHLERKLKEKLFRPGRPTPEKDLQSWLIRTAFESGGRLKPLNDALGGQYWFVSDEIAVRFNSKKVVPDLLLVKVDAEGLACLVNVELKSARLMETFQQVICFRAVLEHPDLHAIWREFAEIMTGEKFEWQPSQETCGVVVWPAIKIKHDPTRALANQRRKNYERVDLVGYRDINGYTLECEKPVGVA